MISCARKLCRYLTICPVVFLFGRRWQVVWSLGKAVLLWVDKHVMIQWMCVFLAGMALVLYQNSVSLYTYDEEGVPEYLGRIPIWKLDDWYISLPGYLLQKSGTGRFYLEFDRKQIRQRKVLIRYGKYKRLYLTQGNGRIVIDTATAFDLHCNKCEMIPW